MSRLAFLIGSFAAIFGLLVGPVGRCGSPENLSGSDTEGLDASEDPARMVVELFTINREMGEEIARLRAEVERLQRQLAETRVQLDLYKSGGAVRDWSIETVQPVVMHDDITRLQVLNVNRDMKAVVISGGLRAGMRVGMIFSVLRDDEVIASVRLIEVRENFAGGLVEVLDRNRFPEVGDRLVLSRMQDG
ncbi:MAG TPA: hypothetical protein PJ991_04365 [Kiritimatiellia bacterium]|nr:hypothetical protein [Kiritimatiellia bacterium]